MSDLHYIRALSGGAFRPEKTITSLTASPTQFQAGGYSYVVADMGKERLVKNITFNIYYSGVQDTLTVTYKSLSGDDNTEQVLRTILLQNECSNTSGSSPNEFTINATFYGRLLFFKFDGLSTTKITDLTIDAAVLDSPYVAGTTTAVNYKYLPYDEDIRDAPAHRLSIMRATNNISGIYLGGDDEATVPVTQISFNAITTKATLFKLQYRADSFDIDAQDLSSTSGWTDIKTFRVVDYDRLPNTEISDDGLDSSGTVITDTSLPASRLSNNGLVGWVFRPETDQNYLLTIMESWTDGTNNYFRVNANLSELGIVPRTKYFIERPNVVTFTSTDVSAIQLKQISGGETKINSLKAYVNLIDGTTGDAVSPTTGDDQLEWALQIESI